MYENLQIGDIGNDVKILQGKLKELGYYNAVITGSFGLSTLEGVKKFQKDNNILDNGIVDNITWEKIYEYTEPKVMPISVYPTLRIGSSGEYVIDLQTKLKALLYYVGDVNGVFDLETENAVKRFQINNSLTSDGIVGSQTWNKINSAFGNLNDCAIENDSDSDNGDNEELTYTVVSGDRIFMGNIE